MHFLPKRVGWLKLRAFAISIVEHIMSVSTVASVDVQPFVTLERWRVRETRSGQRHFVGYCVENKEARVSSAIQSFDSGTAVGVTSSGRRYLLSGSPCFDGEARRVWEELAGQDGIGETKDVSMEFMAPGKT
jgi:hypothetical protein